MKDYFSIQSDSYSKYRPVYPDELYDLLIPFCNKTRRAWDCGTGNGQVAYKLSEYFDYVFATDISIEQIGNAVAKSNIEYRIEPADKNSFPNKYFDLITVAQAIHWFDLDNFYKEVKRTLKPGGIIAVIGYSLVRFNTKIDLLINQFHEDILGDYWDEARNLVDNHYNNLPFPFEEIPSSDIAHKRKWTLDELRGYLSTWSALQHYIQQNNVNPLHQISKKLQQVWGEDKNLIGKTPIFTRIAQI